MKDRTFYRCDECKQVTPKRSWLASYVDCELCGSHEAVSCPECGEDYDMEQGSGPELIKVLPEKTDK